MSRVNGWRVRRSGSAYVWAGCVLLVLGVGWAVLQGSVDEAGLVATVLGLLVSLVPYLLPLTTAWAVDDGPQVRIDSAALADRVEQVEGRQWRLLVGGDRQRIALHYTLVDQYLPGASVPAPHGRLPGITAYYQAMRPRRLVVTGAPGAGKTVLALELLLGLVEGRGESDPVPVRVSLSAWTPGTSLEQLLVSQLRQNHGVPRRQAERLVAHRLILPVLDGLDEMDPDLVDGAGQCPDPLAPRARAALHALHAYGEGRWAGPLVLTCRAAHYDAFAGEEHLRDAARIRIEPVPVEDALAYLTERTGAGPRWQPLLAHLRDEPDSVLARCLSTPWRLTLVATSYRLSGDPAELMALPTAHDVDEHLLGRLIPATHELHPPERGYTAEEIREWLARIARDLQEGNAGRPVADIHWHRLWRLAGRARVRRWDGALTALVAGAGIPLAWLTSYPIAVATVTALFAVLTVRVAMSPADDPLPFDQWLPPDRQRRANWRTALGGVVAGAATGGIVTGATGDALAGVMAGLTAGCLAAVVVAFAHQIEARAAVVATPRQALRAGAGAGLSCAVPSLLMASTPLIAAWRGPRIAASPVADALPLLVPLSCLVAAVAGPAFWVIFGASPRRYLAFTLCAGSHRLLPLRLIPFLEYAHRVGLLRLSGSAYQFRHRELQLWLARSPQGGDGRLQEPRRPVT
ncbi:NACHT domain-containing protein [Streptomyces sp. NBC_00658]|uniref:NACHT domain-containing protein n=1 Tax=Streptomyces sp. NBC_00658 TaxID=2975800 RepID=UPI00324543AE